jgi:hypothetical protein
LKRLIWRRNLLARINSNPGMKSIINQVINIMS